MLSAENISHIETVIGYQFRERTNLMRAFTAAGVLAIDDDGNRRLAMCGRKLIELYILHVQFATQASREIAATCAQGAASKKRHAIVARNNGFDRYLTRCRRQAHLEPSDTVLGYAVCGIVGASWEDSGLDLGVAFAVVKNLGLLVDQQACVAPSALEGPSLEGPSPATAAETSEAADRETTGAGAVLPVCSSAADAPARATRPSAPEQKKQKKQQSYHRTTVSAADDPPNTLLDTYFHAEQQRYARPGIAPPACQTLYTHPSLDALGSSLIPRKRNTLHYLYATIGSNDTLATLSSIYHQQQQQRHLHGPHTAPNAAILPARPLTLPQRLRAIEHLGATIGYCHLLRRIHILHLYRDSSSSGSSGEAVSHGPLTFIQETNGTARARTRGRPGNPMCKAEAAVTAAMVKAAAGEEEGDGEVLGRSRRAAFSRYRRMGKRWAMLVEVFGLGVLGLVPLGERGGVGDEGILEIPDPIFRSLVRVLEQGQGETLRRFSKAVEWMVRGLASGDTLPADENGERDSRDSWRQEAILRQPKGSEELLRLVSMSGVDGPVGGRCRGL